MKFGFISLGCAKNLVDTENIMGVLGKDNITNDLDQADYVFINTCGFIESAKKESIDTILEISENKKAIVMGCLVERYYEELIKELPEVFLFIRLKDYYRIKQILEEKLGIPQLNTFSFQNRILTTFPHLAYLKISEGCNNHCAFCAIPLIRGKFVSRDLEEIVLEAKDLIAKNVKELVLISQDLTSYGIDINTNLIVLLKRLEAIDKMCQIRLLYLYPDDVSDELIEYISYSKHVMPYFDLPIQHASKRILHLMNRRGNQEKYSELISKIRKKIPKSIIRSTLIVGFPTENDDDFNELKAFILANPIDRLGVFKYSREEDTKAYDLEQVEQAIIDNRYEEILNLQDEIAYEQNLKQLNSIHQVVIEDIEADYYIGRSYAFAPDDIDGYIFIKKASIHQISDIFDVIIIDADSYNLYAKEK